MRQVAILESGGRVEQVTLTFNAATGEVRPMRSKEDSHDYRYFPDPDLPPLLLDATWIEARRNELPELPAARRARYHDTWGLPEYDVGVLTQEPAVAAYFEATVTAGVDPKTAANWVMGEAMAEYNASRGFAVSPTRLAELVSLVAGGTVSLQAAKKIHAELAAGDADPAEVARRLGLVQVRDEDALGSWVAEVIAAHPEEVARFRAGEVKLIGFFVGQVMKRSGGKADPKAIQPLLRAGLSE